MGPLNLSMAVNMEGMVNALIFSFLIWLQILLLPVLHRCTTTLIRGSPGHQQKEHQLPVEESDAL